MLTQRLVPRVVAISASPRPWLTAIKMQGGSRSPKGPQAAKKDTPKGGGSGEGGRGAKRAHSEGGADSPRPASKEASSGGGGAGELPPSVIEEGRLYMLYR